MKFRSLLVVPPALVLGFGLLAALLGDAQPAVLRVEDEAGKILGLLGCVVAATAFERGDYMRRAWLTYGACYALLLVNDTLRMATGGGLVVVRGLVVLLGNASLVAGSAMLARAWSVAGLEEDESAARRRRWLLAAGVVVSLAITGWAYAHDVRSLLAGRPTAIISLASDLGDSAFLVLVAPVMQTTLALRGGVLRWPWGFLTLGGLAWAAYDTSSGIVDALGIQAGLWLVASEALRGFANGYVFVGGLAQRMAVSPDVPPTLSSPGARLPG